ncbi:hypothetical protein FHS86_000247 [Roseimarinus sediminis]
MLSAKGINTGTYKYLVMAGGVLIYISCQHEKSCLVVGSFSNLIVVSVISTVTIK